MDDSMDDSVFSPLAQPPGLSRRSTVASPVRAPLSPGFNHSLKDLLNDTAAILRDGSLPRDAVLHAVANGMLLLLVGTCVLSYWVMESFARPIAWAIGVGFLLHPVKQFIAKVLVGWLGETRNRLMIVAALEVPGNVSEAAGRWLVHHMVQLVVMMLLGMGVAYLEVVWNHLATVLAFAPLVVTGAIGVLDAWSSFTLASMTHMIIGVAALALAGVIMRQHPVALAVVAHLAWVVVLTLVWPLLYSVLPRWVTIAGSVMIAAVFLLGFSPSGTSAQNGNAPQATPLGNPSRHRTSSELTGFMAFGCVTLLFLSYLPAIVVGMAFAVVCNFSLRFVGRRVRTALSGPVGQVVFPRGVQVLWAQYSAGDAAVRSMLLHHVEEISTILALLFFGIFVVAVPVYFSLSIYHEARDLGASVGGMWNNKSDYVPVYVNEKLTEAYRYIMTEGFVWMDERLQNTTGLTFAMLNTTASSLFAPSVAAYGSGASMEAGWSDLKSLLMENFSTFASLLVHIRDNGRVVLAYALHAFYSALR